MKNDDPEFKKKIKMCQDCDTRLCNNNYDNCIKKKKKKKIHVESKKYVIYENCPICNKGLESILDRDGFVIDYWCNKCGRSYNIDMLEIKEIETQKSLDKWL